ncbi:uncharacterized protein LOC125489913 [Plutella xylostella]|uniref:uncharacterized protein LOC125489913 n=1 Tax=Plutella xylostella TaxID=51655 RepID=UPI00203238DE|nr:uncharacterized protein LOC125489913 [Plutella xylostella]
MRASFTMPEVPPRLVTHKDQYKHPASLPLEPQVEPSWHKELPPLDTTHEGYQVHLDPYLSTSRLHHHPFTADQLRRPSNSRDTVTYYTFDETPWTRTPKPTAGDWWLPRRVPQSVYDREKFKQGFREYRTHNKLFFVPGTFRTETRDNYTKPDRNIHNFEDDVQNYYQQRTSNLPTNISIENLVINNYCTEAGHLGSGRKICTALDQYIEKNKRLDPAKK